MSNPTNSSSAANLTQTAHKVAAQSLLDPKHKNPFAFDSTDPLVLFIVQAVIIISFCNLIGLVFKRIRQPKVISEVIGGIILGPTAMGRIPHFTNAIFPKPSIPFLSLVANIGLVLFLFIVGLEVDFKLMRKNWRAAAGIGLVGLAVPFGIGAAVAVGIYNQFVDHDTVEFGHFLLFICVAFAITAFPVLCRILTELKLLQNNVGLATLAAGVANDVVGWILLALAVTLVNSGAGLTALYVMLVVLGWVLFLTFVVRPVFITLAQRSGSFESGPTPGITCLVLLMMFGSAWFTQIIGVHAIFGAFLVGVIMPHDGGFANILASKIEDLVTVFFLPLYFTLSGLSTDLGKLNDKTIWGWTICVLIAAEVSKFVPCFGMAMWSGMDWRESGAVGSLMACKGLVELIVLNIAFNAGVMNAQVFAMFVLMAVVTTFVTTPLCLAFYPESYRIKKAQDKNLSSEKMIATPSISSGDQRSKFLVVLSQLEHLPSVMAFVKLLQYSPKDQSSADLSSYDPHDEGKTTNETDAPSSSARSKAQVLPRVSAIRLLELSQRTSDVMKASEVAETEKHDPILNIFSTFAALNGVAVPSATMSIVPEADFVPEIAGQAAHLSSQLVVLPWYTGLDRIPQMDGSSVNPMEKMLSGRWDSSPQYASLVRAIFQNVRCDVGVLVDTGSCASPMSAGHVAHQRLLCVFMGGPDDRTALSLVLQLSRRSGVSATVLRVIRSAEPTAQDDQGLVHQIKTTTDKPHVLLREMTVHGRSGRSTDSMYGINTVSGNLASETADNSLWTSVCEAAREMPNMSLETIESAIPLQTILGRVNMASGGSELMVVTGRSRQGGETHATELSQYLKERAGGKAGEAMELVGRLGVAASSEVRKSLGDVTSALVASLVKGRFLVIQAGKSLETEDTRMKIEDMEKMA